MASRAEVIDFVPWSERIEQALPLGVVLSVSILYRFPRLENSADLHSDSAVVGLQAMHLLRGEWSPFLWGSGYQTSVDSAVAAVFFVLFGPTALALRLSTFVAFLALTVLAYLTLRRHVSSAAAASLVSPLVFTPTAVHTYVFSPPRQASLTLVFLGIFLLDGAREGRRRVVRLSLAGGALGFACFADPYAWLFLPSIAFLALPTALAGDPRGRWARVAALLLGGLAGLAPFFAVFARPDATRGVFALTSSAVARNGALLIRDCLPSLLSARIYAPSPRGGWGPWHGPAWFAFVQYIGALGFLLGVVGGGLLAATRRARPPVARLGALGASMLPIAVGGFLFSVMPVDEFSTRYLVAIILTAPFALVPVYERIGPRRFAVFLAPYLVASAVAGWLGYGKEGMQVGPVSELAEDDRAVMAALAARGIRYGIADYWAAYRLTFLSREALVIAPWHASQDRYPPYRERVARAAAVAYVFDPLESLERLRDRQELFASGRTEYFPDFETVRVGRYTAFVLRKDAARANAEERIFGGAPR